MPLFLIVPVNHSRVLCFRDFEIRAIPNAELDGFLIVSDGVLEAPHTDNQRMPSLERVFDFTKSIDRCMKRLKKIRYNVLSFV